MDRNGNSLEFAYDLSGKLSTAMDTMGRLIQFEYYPWVEGDVRSGRLRSVGDFSGRKVIYSYDGKGDLAAANFEGRETLDIDLFVKPTKANIKKDIKALKEFGHDRIPFF